MELLPTDRNELPARRMRDSFVTAVIPLSRNPELRERYVTYYGSVRVGRLLEDLDIFAGKNNKIVNVCHSFTVNLINDIYFKIPVWSCYKHILNPRAEGPPNPYSVVTALVDTIHFSGDSMNV